MKRGGGPPVEATAHGKRVLHAQCRDSRQRSQFSETESRWLRAAVRVPQLSDNTARTGSATACKLF